MSPCLSLHPYITSEETEAQGVRPACVWGQDTQDSNPGLPMPSLTLSPPSAASPTPRFCGNYSEKSKQLFSTQNYKYPDTGG